jgi:hypothetical protein
VQPDAAVAGQVATPAAWTLWRQDDNGNRVRVETFATRSEALALQAQFEARHHKQIYWVEAG